MRDFSISARFIALILTFLTSLHHVAAVMIRNNVLVISPDQANAATVTGTMDGYGIPYEVLLIPMAGAALPKLNETNGNGNYGLFIVISQVSYNYGNAWRSAMTQEQWTMIYDYQVLYGVRMVHINAYPGGEFGATALGGCCAADDPQTMQLDKSIAASQFPTAGLKTPILNTTGLWHYPAKITDTTSTVSFITLQPNNAFPDSSSGGVINTFSNGRQQMVFFMSFGIWSAVSNYLNHAWINWGLFGMYAGYRRVLLNTQIDDLFLPSAIYGTNGGTFRLRPSDVTEHISWQSDLNNRLVSGGNAGSSYFIEFAYNGNGNFIYTQTLGEGKTCADPVHFVRDETVTPLEYQKIVGTGIDMWPPNSSYDWTLACMKKDPLVAQFMDKSVRDVFGLMTHTFTHLGENPITYDDAYREITFNQKFAKLATFDKAPLWSGKGIVPPAITGLHNGDALKAWADAGLTSCVGDNTRPPLMSPFSAYWPFITNTSNNGFDGMVVVPRFSSRIYFNCDTANCTLSEWINTSAGSGDIFNLLKLERESTAKNLLAIRQDPYMFHQANLRWYDVDQLNINGVTKRYSLLQMWTESILAEFTQYANWPIITKKHDDMATMFMNRMARDQCHYNISWTTASDGKSITGFTVGCDGNKCSVPIPVTIPVGNSVTNVGSFKTEQIGNDPMTLWVTLTGSTKSFTLTTPIKLLAAGGAGSKSASAASSSGKASSTGSASSGASGTTMSMMSSSMSGGSSMATSSSPANSLTSSVGMASAITSDGAVNTPSSVSSAMASSPTAVVGDSAGTSTQAVQAGTNDNANPVKRDAEEHKRHKNRRRHLRA